MIQERLTISLLIVLLFSVGFPGVEAAPVPRGSSYQITAEILSVNLETQEVTHLEGSTQATMITLRLPMKVRIVRLGNRVHPGEVPELLLDRKQYVVGQTVEVHALFDKHIFLKMREHLKRGALMEGIIYSHGDETGDWFVFTIEKLSDFTLLDNI